MNDRVRVETRDNVATVTLSRTDKHNAMDWAMLEAVRATALKLKKDKTVRAVILRGDGPSFCSGLDVKSMFRDKRAMAIGMAALRAPVRNRFQDWSMRWREIPAPVIAVIHGNCFGAGIQLALGADIRIAAADAKISIMESRWGLVPDMGGPTLLRELIPLDLAKELTFTARILSGSEAKALGLVSHVSEQPLQLAEQLAGEIGSRSPDAIAAAKFLLQEAWDAGERGALSAERRRQRQVMGYSNNRIAIRRGMAKDNHAADLPYMPRKVNN